LSILIESVQTNRQREEDHCLTHPLQLLVDFNEM